MDHRVFIAINLPEKDKKSTAKISFPVESIELMESYVENYKRKYSVLLSSKLRIK